ncbi:MAG: formate dehydrogenase subunit gamma [Dokdonella sp.]
MKQPRPNPAARPVSCLPPRQLAAVQRALDDNTTRLGALLPILHAVQDALGYIPPDALPTIAYELNLTRADVHGVISFYHDFRSTPPGLHVVKLCRAEACQARGARALETHAKNTLGIDFGQTTPDGAVTLEAVYCLGNCGCGPSVLVDADELHANVTAARFDALVRRAREATA